MSSEIVLIQPKSWEGKSAYRLPYNLLFIASYNKNRFKSRIIDGSVQDIDLSGLERPALFGISCMTGVQIKYALDAAAKIRRKFPDTPIIWGGWHPSLLPEQTKNSGYADGVVVGQGEIGINNFIGCSEADGIYISKPAPINDLKVDYEYVDVKKYLRTHGRHDRAVNFINSVGCPFNCAFCAIAMIYKRKYFFRDVDIVLDELDVLSRVHGADYICFDDDNFFINKSRTMELCRGIIERGMNIGWSAWAQPRLFNKNFGDAESLDIINRSGCDMIYVGAESGSRRVLDAINKQSYVEDTLEFVEHCKRAGIVSALSLMTSFPGMDEREDRETLDMALMAREKNPKIQISIKNYTPYPGTLLFETAVRHGFEPPETMEGWVGFGLTKFVAPWTSVRHHRFIRAFEAYYFPYSGNQEMGRSRLKFLLRKMLRPVAGWRAKHRFFWFPIDALIVTWLRRKEF
jgi:anaerobic magnesium-protoporphyrin IX monomethyl ester cyclase